MEKGMAQRIKELRQARDLTLEQVADVVGVGKSTVRKWETGFIENMRRDKIAKLAAALHTTPDYLMGWSDNPQPAQADTPVLSAAEQELIRSFRSLNPEGQQKVLDYSADLSASGRYIKTTSDNTIPKQA